MFLTQTPLCWIHMHTGFNLLPEAICYFDNLLLFKVLEGESFIFIHSTAAIFFFLNSTWSLKSSF